MRNALCLFTPLRNGGIAEKLPRIQAWVDACDTRTLAQIKTRPAEDAAPTSEHLAEPRRCCTVHRLSPNMWIYVYAFTANVYNTVMRDVRGAWRQIRQKHLATQKTEWSRLANFANHFGSGKGIPFRANPEGSCVQYK